MQYKVLTKLTNRLIIILMIFLQGESLNKKIKFDVDETQQDCKEKSTKKMSLFNDDDDDDGSDHENRGKLVSDFKLKLRFDGDKGKKVIYIRFFF